MNAQFESMTLREQVEVEALATGYRREKARQGGLSGAGVLGPGADIYNGVARVRRIREIAAELAAERRTENARRVGTPSDLIKTIKADWPEQFAAVKAYAAAEGLSLGEAWANLIRDAVAILPNGRGK